MRGARPTKAMRATIRAADELVKWRRHWERSYASPPGTLNGFEDVLAMWKVAGELMDLRGLKRRMP